MEYYYGTTIGSIALPYHKNILYVPENRRTFQAENIKDTTVYLCVAIKYVLCCVKSYST